MLCILPSPAPSPKSRTPPGPGPTSSRRVVLPGSFPLVPGPQIAWLLVPACAPSFRSVGFRLLVAEGSFPFWCRDLRLPGCWYLPARLLSGRGPSVCWWLRAPSFCRRDLTFSPLVTSLRALFQVGWLRSTGGRAGRDLTLPAVGDVPAGLLSGLPVAAILLLPGPRSAVSSLEGHGVPSCCGRYCGISVPSILDGRGGDR